MTVKKFLEHWKKVCLENYCCALGCPILNECPFAFEGLRPLANMSDSDINRLIDAIIKQNERQFNVNPSDLSNGKEVK